MNIEDKYTINNITKEEVSPPSKKRKKKKNRAIAVILGLAFGPFGTLYFGWAVFFTTVITVILVSLLIAFFSPFRIPEWYGLVLNLFYGFWGFMLASIHNENAEQNDSVSLAGLNLMGMNGWLVRVMLWTTGLYSMVMLFSEGRWILAILTPILFIPLITWIVEQIISFLMGIVMAIFTR